MQIHAQLGCQVAPIDDCLDEGVEFNLSIIVYLVIYMMYHESRRCTRNTYPESYITKYTSIRRIRRIPDSPNQILALACK